MIASRSAAPDRGEERVESRLDRVLAQQRLGGLLVGVDPQRLVGAVEQRLGALAQLGPRGARAAQHENRLRRRPGADERLKTGGRAPRCGPTRQPL